MQKRIQLLATLVVLPLATLLSSGCAHQFRYDVKAGDCLNPVEQDCTRPEDASRPLELRIYALSSCDGLDSLEWIDFVEGRARDLLGDRLLASPETRIVERQEELEPIIREFPKKTRCFLLVALGRFEGESSIVVLDPRCFQRSASLLLEGYDIKIAE